MNLEIRYGELKKTLACKSHCYDRYKKYEEKETKILENSNKSSNKISDENSSIENEEEEENENIINTNKKKKNDFSYFNMVDMDRVVMFNPSLNNHFIFEIGGVSLPDKDEKGNEIPFQEIESRWKKINIIDISKYGGVNVDLTEKKGIISNFFSYKGLIKSKKNNESFNMNFSNVDNNSLSKENNENDENHFRRSQKLNTINILTSNFNINENKLEKRKNSEISIKKKKNIKFKKKPKNSTKN